MIIQGSHAPCSIPYHTFFPNRMLIGKLMYPLRLSKTYPSFLNLKEGSTFLTKPLFPQEREDVTALLGAQNRYAIRLADHQRSSPWLCGLGPHGIAVYSLRLISWLFADNLQISCDSLGGFEEKV